MPTAYAEENYEWVYPSILLGHVPATEINASSAVNHVACSFGDYAVANLYFPANYNVSAVPLSGTKAFAHCSYLPRPSFSFS